MLNSDKSTQTDTSDIVIPANDDQALLSGIRRAADRLEQRLARGTGDVTEQANAARGQAPSQPVKRPSLIEQTERILTERSLSQAELVRELGVPAGRVSQVIKDLRPKLYNMGTEDEPRWTFRIGDVGGTETLYPLVERLIREQPMTTSQLVAATGARESRVQGAVIHLQRTRTGILNLGRANAGRWFLVPEGVKIARLEPKRRG